MIREAKTENGWVRGIEAADPRITVFKGIPFAAPPIGENRWRAPQPAADWEGVRDASRFAPISMQSIPGLGTDVYCKEWHVDPEIPMDEDCLYLNVWTSAKTVDEKQPVLVWYFGGGLQWGYPSEMEFDGERLAKRGVVVVTVNYRINCFGFLAHKDLTKEAPEAPTNFGNLDQQAGLRWVVRNIASFGGDPEHDDAVIFKERKRLLFLGLPWTFTKYTVTPSFITVESGLLSTTEDDCYMYKVADVKLTTSLMERIFKLGTIVCYTGDVTNPELKLVHVKHSREIKNYLLKQSEAARLKRRTLNTVDIGAHGADMADLDHDGIPDSME